MVRHEQGPQPRRAPRPTPRRSRTTTKKTLDGYDDADRHRSGAVHAARVSSTGPSSTPTSSTSTCTTGTRGSTVWASSRWFTATALARVRRRVARRRRPELRRVTSGSPVHVLLGEPVRPEEPHVARSPSWATTCAPSRRSFPYSRAPRPAGRSRPWRSLSSCRGRPTGAISSWWLRSTAEIRPPWPSDGRQRLGWVAALVDGRRCSRRRSAPSGAHLGVELFSGSAASANDLVVSSPSGLQLSAAGSVTEHFVGGGTWTDAHPPPERCAGAHQPARGARMVFVMGMLLNLGLAALVWDLGRGVCGLGGRSWRARSASSPWPRPHRSASSS